MIAFNQYSGARQMSKLFLSCSPNEIKVPHLLLPICLYSDVVPGVFCVTFTMLIKRPFQENDALPINKAKEYTRNFLDAQQQDNSMIFVIFMIKHNRIQLIIK